VANGIQARQHRCVRGAASPLALNQAHFISAASVSGAAVDVGTAFRAAVVDARGGVTVEL
jgi:hypothetical protein